MVRFNRKTLSERREERHTPPLPPSVPSPLHADLSNYRIPRRNEVSSDQESHDYQRKEPREQHSSRNRERPSNRHRRRYSPSPRRRRCRDHSLDRVRHRNQPKRESSRVHFQPIAMEISPIREPARSQQRRNSVHRRSVQGPQLQPSLAERLGPIPANSPLVRVTTRRTTSVLKFENVPTNVDLLSFLTLLGREVRSVIGATRLYNYEQKTVGDSIFVYLVDQEEIDAAVGRGFTFNFTSGQQLIKPLLLSAAITSIYAADAQDPSLSLIPTIMLRNLVPVTTRQAIAAAIDAVDLIAQRVNYVTHVRLPAKGLDLAKTSSLAFVGINSKDQVNELNGQEVQRCGKKVPLHKSEQVPVLVPVGFMRQNRDAAWIHRAAQGNMLIARSNPFE